MTPADISKVLEFCFRAFSYVPPEKKDALFEKLKQLDVESMGDSTTPTTLEDVQMHLTADEKQILEILGSRRMICKDPLEIDSFALDTIDGLAPRLEHGSLGLRKAEQSKIDKRHFLSPSFLDGKYLGIRDGSVHIDQTKVIS